ncbi:tRNA pseudouridine(55) synthase TruB [uncultured Agrococcus sp.]|uniref:tRNA pseudouridine(55) synthase TruB n=1 Tax=uncultured Agrococcus sp. TaxID=382258 RepID=UPI0025FE138E|nr:tRNA pseudouridine(55) synthase TruB [uncultured Agrococcus sp.]
MPNGILLVDKPAGVTSHTVVAMARRALKTKKVGHAGTLDPMATGLLVLGVGASTRLLTFMVGADKTYEATITLGASTVTDDAEGDVTETADASSLTMDAIRAAVAPLSGEIEQVPSAVSAIKVDGTRAYARVRGGEDVELKARSVTVSRFDLDNFQAGDRAHVDAVIDCSSGTYIRALARDLGASLGVGGHLSALRRTHVGAFHVAEAVMADEITADALIDPVAAIEKFLPVAELTAESAQLLRNGRRPDSDITGLVAAVRDGTLIGIARGQSGNLVPVANMPEETQGRQQNEGSENAS